MYIAMLQNDRTLTDLACRLYQVPDGGRLNRLLRRSVSDTEAQAKQAADALRRANPLLSDLSSLPPGTVIAVPEVAGLKFTDQVQAVRPFGESLTAGVFESTSAFFQDEEKSLAERKKELDDLLKAFEGGEVKPLSAFAAFGGAVRATREQANALAKTLSELKQLQGEILAQIKEDVAAMEQLLT